MQPNIGITSRNLNAVTAELSKILADTVLLYTKTRKFHWNVSGPSFMELHKLFEHQYKQLEEAIDEIAERINKLGSKVPGTMAEFIKLSALKEAAGKVPAQQEMIKELLSDHESVIKTLRKAVQACDEDYNDAGTADFLTGLMEDHETIAWTLRRYLD
jgi:starvation-inducible DNA-binding protein